MPNNTMTLLDPSANTLEAFLVPLNGAAPHPVEGIVTIGRSGDNDLVLLDPHVSGNHCRIEKRPKGFYLRDLKSRNGVTVNGLKVYEGQLLDGAQVQIGSTAFVFQTRKLDRDDPESPLKSKNKT